MNGNVITASFIMFDTALAGWFIAFLFFTYQIILYMKARNVNLNFITGIFFVSLYIAGSSVSSLPIINPMAIQAIFLILVLELAGVLFYAFWR